MPFEETPKDTETGSFEDSTVDDRTTEVWVEDNEGRAYGFIMLPKDDVPWRKMSEEVENAVSQTGFSAVDYYENMLSYQIKETSFGAENRLSTWLASASNEIIEQLEDHVPEPQGDSGRDAAADAALALVDEFAQIEDETATVAEFRQYIEEKSAGDKGK